MSDRASRPHLMDQQVISYSDKSTQIKDVDFITDKDQEVGCSICFKAFMGTAALNNHAKIEHYDVFENGDSDSWTCSISEINRIRKGTRDRGPRDKILDDKEATYFSKEEVISAMSPGKLTALVPENVQYIIMKDVDDDHFVNMKRKRRILEFSPNKSSSVDDPDEDGLEKNNDEIAHCDECGSVFSNRYTLKNHKKAKHFLDEERINLMCEICGKICAVSMGDGNHLPSGDPSDHLPPIT
ncbi:unnamed protein product [Diatraea saccharalis]|uniref:C2H2-type domain-containing protein n=1 Tax=Diatraea saccharalis TaxID=40085 RepID=A0A9N9WH64_9NEOP|nr:unnamed protein product [Diatraea saccharalis]